MEILGISGIAAITVICYLIAAVCKAFLLDGKWLPCICGVAGAVLGVTGMYFMPEFPATDILTALAVGIVSGLAATGGHELVKNLRTKQE